MLDFEGWPLVETEWLASHLDDPSIRIVDARWRGDGTGYQQYLTGHIPGAVHLDWHTDLNRQAGRLHDILIPPDKFATIMEKSGIGSDTVVIAYADFDYSGAARIWWSLRLYGHHQVALLNGGFNKWLAEDRAITKIIPMVQRARFTSDPQPEWLATIGEIKEVLQSQTDAVRLVDTRPPEQYYGQAVWTPLGSQYLEPGKDWILIEGQRMRAGHIPGAVHLESSGNLESDKEWIYLPKEDLRQRAAEAGITSDKRVITYCGVGISGSLGLFALYLAGFRNLSLYDASWFEWGTNHDNPIEKSD